MAKAVAMKVAARSNNLKICIDSDKTRASAYPPSLLLLNQICYFLINLLVFTNWSVTNLTK